MLARLLAACGLLALALALATSAAGVPVRTLASTGGEIVAFAQDGGRIAWAGGPGHGTCPWRVRVRTLATGTQTAVSTNGGPTCRHDIGFQPESVAGGFVLALAGMRALWDLIDSGNSRYVTMLTGSLARPRDTELEQLVYQYGYGEGDHLGAVAGDGGTLVYSWIRTSVEEVGDCFEDGACETPVVGGGVRRVDGAAIVDVPGAPAAVELAAAAGRIALVVATEGGEAPSSGQGGPVEVRDAGTGALVASVSPAGTPVAVALTETTLAVLVRNGGTAAIERYDAATGALLGSTSVTSGVAPELSMAGRRLVFRVGRSIRLLDTATGAVSKLAKAARTPIGLSIEGNRVAWAEVVEAPDYPCPPGCGRSRVRAVVF